MKKILQVFAVATLVFGAAATAQATEGWYGRVDGGYSVDATIGGQADYYDEDRVSEGNGGGDYYRRDDIELENDWMAAIGAGHAFANGFRAEGEIAYRTNDADDYGDTTITAQSVMVNAFYDFNRGGRVQPYVGAGAGYAWVEPDGAEDDSAFAYQGLIGLAIALSERWSVDAGYRYFWVNDLDFQYVDADYEHQAVTLGLRYQFTPPPAPTPPTPPQPPVVAQPPEPPTPPAPVACRLFRLGPVQARSGRPGHDRRGGGARAAMQSERGDHRRPHRHVRRVGLQCRAVGAARGGGARCADHARHRRGAHDGSGARRNRPGPRHRRRRARAAQPPHRREHRLPLIGAMT
jgi:opacity protein-like surface antigen